MYYHTSDLVVLPSNKLVIKGLSLYLVVDGGPHHVHTDVHDDVHDNSARRLVLLT